jgi:hypothetical protein
MLAGLVVAAVVWAVWRADAREDVLRFVAGAGVGAAMAGAMRWADGSLARGAGARRNSRLTGIAVATGPVLGAVLAAVLVRYGDLGSNLDVVLAGVLAGVGALYPLS